MHQSVLWNCSLSTDQCLVKQKPRWMLLFVFITITCCCALFWAATVWFCERLDDPVCSLCYY